MNTIDLVTGTVRNAQYNGKDMLTQTIYYEKDGNRKAISMYINPTSPVNNEFQEWFLHRQRNRLPIETYYRKFNNGSNIMWLIFLGTYIFAIMGIQQQKIHE